MRPVSRRQLISRLRKLGFDGPHPGGKHAFMIKGSVRLRIPNPHKDKTIGVGLLTRILRQADVTDEEWESVS